MARIIVVSYRLGLTDGVSVEAQKWIAALRSMRHDVATVAGDGVADTVMPGLAIRDPRTLSENRLFRTLKNADIVVVENMASLPLNLPARDALFRLLADRPTLFRHHDLAWQRVEWRGEPAPPDRPHWRHVTINEISRRELSDRGVIATTIYNTFDVDPPLGRREATREALTLSNERLVLFPSRAIGRKNVAGAIRLAEELGAVLWVLGPPEDGFDDEFQSLVEGARISVKQGAVPGLDIHDAYAASDLVVVPSTWEGFGNPVLESVTHRRPLAVYPYPVLEEIRGFGFDFFDLSDVAAVSSFLDSPAESLLEQNLEVARRHFNVADLPGRLGPILKEWDLK